MAGTHRDTETHRWAVLLLENPPAAAAAKKEEACVKGKQLKVRQIESGKKKVKIVG